MSPDDSIYSLVNAAAQGVLVIFSNENGPRPAPPYITLAVRWASAGSRHLAPPDDDGGQLVYSHRDATVELQAFGAAAYEALDELGERLGHPVFADMAVLLNIAVFDRGRVQSLPAERDGARFEARGVLELSIRYTVGVTENVGLIETVEVQQLPTDGGAQPPYLPAIITINHDDAP
ncbi:phage neck terminator protein [Achromobacter aloeverae]